MAPKYNYLTAIVSAWFSFGSCILPYVDKRLNCCRCNPNSPKEKLQGQNGIKMLINLILWWIAMLKYALLVGVVRSSFQILSPCTNKWSSAINFQYNVEYSRIYCNLYRNILYYHANYDVTLHFKTQKSFFFFFLSKSLIASICGCLKRSCMYILRY